MRALAITPTRSRRSTGTARETYPHECCGALLEADGVIVATFALPNTTDGPAARRFLVGPDEYRRAEAMGRASSEALWPGSIIRIRIIRRVRHRPTWRMRGRISCTLSCRSPKARRATPPAGVCARIARDSTKEN